MDFVKRKLSLKGRKSRSSSVSSVKPTTPTHSEPSSSAPKPRSKPPITGAAHHTETEHHHSLHSAFESAATKITSRYHKLGEERRLRQRAIRHNELQVQAINEVLEMASSYKSWESMLATLERNYNRAPAGMSFYDSSIKKGDGPSGRRVRDTALDMYYNGELHPFAPSVAEQTEFGRRFEKELKGEMGRVEKRGEAGKKDEYTTEYAPISPGFDDEDDLLDI